MNLPKRLTAENGAKTALSGEFFETIVLDNPDYCGCGKCDYCLDFDCEQPTVSQEIPISWTNIKAIYAAAIKHFEENNELHRDQKQD